MKAAVEFQETDGHVAGNPVITAADTFSHLLTCLPFSWFSNNFRNRHVPDVLPLFAVTPAVPKKEH
jgi:hypothetical protein